MKKRKTKFQTGTTWFVDENNGSDDNDGLSIESAFKTERNAYLHCKGIARDVTIRLPEEKDSNESKGQIMSTIREKIKKVIDDIFTIFVLTSAVITICALLFRICEIIF